MRVGGEGIKAENNGAARLCGHSMCSACAGELCNYVVCVCEYMRSRQGADLRCWVKTSGTCCCFTTQIPPLGNLRESSQPVFFRSQRSNNGLNLNASTVPSYSPSSKPYLPSPALHFFLNRPTSPAGVPQGSILGPLLLILHIPPPVQFHSGPRLLLPLTNCSPKVTAFKLISLTLSQSAPNPLTLISSHVPNLVVRRLSASFPSSTSPKHSYPIPETRPAFPPSYFETATAFLSGSSSKALKKPNLHQLPPYVTPTGSQSLRASTSNSSSLPTKPSTT